MGDAEVQTVERTETDALLQTPLKVTLGGKEVEVPIKRLRKEILWRRKCGELAQELVIELQVVDGDVDFSYAACMPAIFGAGVDKVVDMFYLYADFLDQEEVEKIATDEEIIQASMVVFKHCFPFVKILIESTINLIALGQNPKA